MSLIVNDISKSFILAEKIIPVLGSVSFSAEDGEFCCIIGPSGCGKSTLLRIMIGLEHETSGTVTYKGRELALGSGTTSMVFQHFALFPWLTVFENVEFGLRMAGEGVTKRSKLVEELIVDVGLEGFEGKHPKELSGGMRQRVGIARALAVSPRLLFMDEPFSALDAFTAESLRADLLRIWHKRKMTVIMVTHLVEEAVELADKIVVFTPAPGRVEKIMENKLERPRAKRSSDFYKMVDALTKCVRF